MGILPMVLSGMVRPRPGKAVVINIVNWVSTVLAFFKNRRRRHIRRQEFPPHWLGIIKANVGFYGKLSPADKRELQEHILVFNTEKRFEGCGGLEITDEIRITIAAQACLLLLHRDTDYYPGLETILVYPEAFLVSHQQRPGNGIIYEVDDIREGESWHRGTVVLSWDDVRKSSSDIHDGHNVVLHEFAHQIDTMAGQGDSTPVLNHKSSYLTWARALRKDYNCFVKEIESGRDTLFGPYAATNPSEFFAVATEYFFERPLDLKRVYPELYEQLKLLYQQDPTRFR
jgi:Mlc titration factor MtfA (ptsG expression regulator)